jgi:hypothetical protein
MIYSGSSTSTNNQNLYSAYLEIRLDRAEKEEPILYFHLIPYQAITCIRETQSRKFISESGKDQPENLFSSKVVDILRLDIVLRYSRYVSYYYVFWLGRKLDSI